MKWPQIEADGVDTNLGEITNCTLGDITEGQFPHMCVCVKEALFTNLPVTHLPQDCVTLILVLDE